MKKKQNKTQKIQLKKQVVTALAPVQIERIVGGSIIVITPPPLPNPRSYGCTL